MMAVEYQAEAQYTLSILVDPSTQCAEANRFELGVGHDPYNVSRIERPHAAELIIVHVWHIYALEQHSPGVLNVLLDLNQELNSFSAVKQTMVIGQGEIHHGTNLDLTVDGNRTVLDCVKAENSSLRKIDDGSAHQGSENTPVADGEGATSHVFNSKLVVASLGIWSVNKVRNQ